MAQHGYLREYDEGRDRGEDRDRSERDWRDRESAWPRDADRDRSRGFILGDDDRDYSRDRGGDDRGFFERMGDDARSWFGNDDRDDRRDHGMSGASRRNERRSSFSSHPDDHYRSWRQRQIEALDRDYEEYCREREQQFHQSFDSWRQNRQQHQGQQSQANQDELVLSSPSRAKAGTATESTDTAGTALPEGAATLGTNNSENSTTTGRGRR